jgi:hypothetical protein
MKHHIATLSALVLILSMILTACGGSIPNSMFQYEASTHLEELAAIKADPGMAVFFDEPTATDVESTVTFEPTVTDEPAATEEPTATEELTATDEPIATEVPTETDQGYSDEPIATEESIDGFWLNSNDTGRILANVPKDWTYLTTYNNLEIVEEEDTEEFTLTRNTLTSPDNLAVIDFMVFDDYGKTTWTRPLQRTRAMVILNDIYASNTRDVVAMDIQLMPDDSEQITWSSKTCTCTGVIAFKPLKTVTTTNLYLFAVSYQNSARDLYSEVLNYVLGTLDFEEW